MEKWLRKHCRACGSSSLTEVINLGNQYLQGSFVKPGVPSPPTSKFPMELVLCEKSKQHNGCGLAQLRHSVPPEILYKNYWYRSGTNSSMRGHLKTIVEEANEIVGERLDTVLDIGCNDGTLLNFYPDHIQKYGIDPSDIVNDIDKSIHAIKTTFPSKEASEKIGNTQFDIITSIAMFYDLEDPINFAKNISYILKEKGVWVFEVSYLPMMLEMNSFDTICHEHLEYYSLAVLQYIVKKSDLQIFKISTNECNGGSIRCYITHANNNDYSHSENINELNELLNKESRLNLSTPEPYLNFQKNIERLKQELNDLIRDIRLKNERIHIYGASTKGNVLLQWYGIDNSTIECAADRNPHKAGSRTLGTNIPIVLEEDSRAQAPDYYLVLPWHYKREFLIREREIINAGTKMIFPLPEILVIDSDNIDDEISKLNEDY